MDHYMHWYFDVLKKYAVIEGRASRKEYWMFALINFVVSILVAIVATIISLKFLTPLYSLAVLIPGIAVLVRRLHDTSRSGWWALLVFIPIIGWIVLVVFAVQDSSLGINVYGPNPKGVDVPMSPPQAPVMSEVETKPQEHTDIKVEKSEEEKTSAQ